MILPLSGDAAADRGRNSGFEPGIGRVLGRVADASPPEDRFALDRVVEPVVADLLRREIGRVAFILKRSQERERAGDVVIGHHQRRALASRQVAIDLAIGFNDLFVGPLLDRAAKIDPDQLAEHPGIDTFQIIVRNRHE